MTDTTKTDCFAYTDVGRYGYTGLKHRYCDREECRFYKNRESYAAECARLEGRRQRDGEGMAESGMEN